MWIDDDILERSHEPLALTSWVPDRPVVVLGSSNVAVNEVEMERCAEAGISVLKRYGGGGTVLLHGGCVIVSAGVWVSQLYQNKLYFDVMNRAVIAALAAAWPTLANLTQRGLSDIVMGQKKVAGTSLFRSRNYLLYQASLLIEPRIEMIAHYLKHPTKEPDYRQGRSHGDFITGIADLAQGATIEACHAQLDLTLAQHITAFLGDERIEPIEAQIPTLKDRAKLGRSAFAV